MKKVINLLEYLEENCNKKVANEFKEKLDKKMLQLIKEPDAGRNSGKVPEVQWIFNY